MSVEMLQAAAEVVESRFAVRSRGEPIFRTSPVAHRKPRARAALGRKPVPLVITESLLDWGVYQFCQQRCFQVADAVLWG